MVRPKKIKELKVRAAAIMLESNLSVHITNERLAAMLFMNEGTYKKLFKQLYGLAPYTFVMEKRLEKAKVMLLDDYSIQDVSYAIGFNGNSAESNFIKFFKKHTKITPVQWKKSQLVICKEKYSPIIK